MDIEQQVQDGWSHHQSIPRHQWLGCIVYGTYIKAPASLLPPPPGHGLPPAPYVDLWCVWIGSVELHGICKEFD